MRAMLIVEIAGTQEYYALFMRTTLLIIARSQQPTSAPMSGRRIILELYFLGPFPFETFRAIIDPRKDRLLRKRSTKQYDPNGIDCSPTIPYFDFSLS